MFVNTRDVGPFGLSSPDDGADQNGLGTIVNGFSVGAAVRTAREAQHLPLREAAPRVGVGVRFLSELERGKATVALGKVMDAVHGSGLDLALVPRSGDGAEPPPPEGYAKYLGLDYPYDWSNRGMEPAVLIRKVLDGGRFPDILRLVGYFGLERVSREVGSLEGREQRENVVGILARIHQGMLLAAQDAEDAPTNHSPA